MEMSEIYNGSQWARGIFLVNKAGATEYNTGRSSTLQHTIVYKNVELKQKSELKSIFWIFIPIVFNSFS